MKKSAIGLVLLSAGVFLAGGTTNAASTAILPGGETPLEGVGGILDQLYGIGNLARVDDNFDQIWSPASGTATATAKFAAFTQDFGYIPQNNDGVFNRADFVHLFYVPGGTDGINLPATTATLTSGHVNFLWALDPSGAPLWTSRPSQNRDSLDHMVTWQILGNEGNPDNNIGAFVIAWEDLRGGGDRDFNDLIVEVDIASAPIPASVWLFGSGLLGLGGIARRKKAA